MSKKQKAFNFIKENKINILKWLIVFIVITFLASLVVCLYSYVFAIGKTGGSFFTHYKAETFGYGVVGGIIITPLFYLYILHHRNKNVLHKVVKSPRTNPNLENYGITLDKKHYLPFNVLNKHTAILGATGSGKTYFIKKMINQIIMKRKSKVFFINGKFDTDFIQDIKSKQKLEFSIDSKNCKAKYNLFRNKKTNEIISLLCEINDYSLHKTSITGTKHHQDQEKNLWRLLIEELKTRNSEISIKSLLAILKTNKENYEHNKELLKVERSYFNTLVGILNSLKNVSWLAQSSQEGISIEEMIHSKDKFFYFNLSTDDVYEEALGKILLFDIKQSIFTNKSKNQPITLILDEFSSFATQQIQQLIEKGRSYNCEIVLATQSVSQLKNISEAFTDAIFSSIKTLFIFESNDITTTNYVCETLGTKKEYLKTEQIEDDVLTNKGSQKVVDSFLIHPNTLKNLELGQCVFRTILKDNKKTTPIIIKIL